MEALQFAIVMVFYSAEWGEEVADGTLSRAASSGSAEAAWEFALVTRNNANVLELMAGAVTTRARYSPSHSSGRSPARMRPSRRSSSPRG